MKKVLVMGDYFYPDVASTGQLLTELCREIQNELKITVLTSIPSFKYNMYVNPINFELLENIDVYRIKTKPFNKRNKFSRIKHVLEHYFLIKKAIKQIDKQDIVLTISQPPILGGLQGLYAKRIHNAAFIYNIQDFNPEQAEAVRYFKLKFIYKLLRKIDIRTCTKADRLIVVGRDMLDTLKARGINMEKVSMINNWVDEECVYPLEGIKVEEFKSRYGLKGKFVIMYSGNIGLYYDLENLVKVFGRFSDDKNLVFAFVGDGAKKTEIEDWVQKNKINNIRFIPFQNKEELVFSLNAADAHLVVNSKGIKGVSVPSKIYGVMSVGKYVIGVLEKGSEAARIIEDSGCGVVVEPGAYEKVYEVIKKTVDMNRDKLNTLGLNGRNYLVERFGKGQSINKYMELFKQVYISIFSLGW